jgi:neurotransmitter:Na+ symporter, NSS family
MTARWPLTSAKGGGDESHIPEDPVLNLTAAGWPRSVFTSRFTFQLAALGAVIGLGNLWRFPYLVYRHGGGAFLIPYVVALVTAAVPILLLEYSVGHSEKGSAPLAFAKLHRSSEWLGWWMPLFACFGILLYYQVVLGWCAAFMTYAFDLRWGQDAQAFFLDRFLGLTGSPGVLGDFRGPSVAGAAVIWMITWAICTREVRRGIEKLCWISLPLLFALTLGLAIWGLTLPGAAQGWTYYLTPDWGKLLSWEVWIAAYGQAFFTLSVGFGVMHAYASYLPERMDLVRPAVVTGVVDTLHSLVAGLAVFAVLGYLAQVKGLPVERVVQAGPILAFVTYPEAIAHIPVLARVFGVLFFLSLLLAGLTAGVAVVEALVGAVLDKFKVRRRALVTAVCAAGFLGSLAFTTGAGLYWLDIVDHFLTQYGVVTACLLECVILGHFLKTGSLRAHLNAHARLGLGWGWEFLVKYLVPVVLLSMLVRSVSQELSHPYGGYPLWAVLVLGVGWLAVTLAAAFALALYPWDPERLKHEHTPGSGEFFG